MINTPTLIDQYIENEDIHIYLDPLCDIQETPVYPTSEIAIIDITDTPSIFEPRKGFTYYAKEIGQYLYSIVFTLILPIVINAFIPTDIVQVLFWMGMVTLMVTNLWIILESICSFRIWNMSTSLHNQSIYIAPTVIAVIIPAYLPNEIDVLPDSIRSMSAFILPTGFILRIIVAHNGGKPEQIQIIRNNILTIALELNPHILLEEIYAEGSRSKAENINKALDHLAHSILRPDIAAIFDADHNPDPNSMIYALQSMQHHSADILQGRCAINRGSTKYYNILRKINQIEFDVIYGVHHAGGYLLRDYAFFGGTNGYFKFDLLAKLRMDPNKLTEDIDSSFRAFAEGCKIIFDPNVVSFEMAPPRITSLLKQRRRWAQGWTEVAISNISLLWNSNISLYKKIMSFFLLHWREIYFYLIPYALPAAIVYVIKTDSGLCYPLLAACIFQIFIPIIMAFISAYHVRNDITDLSLKDYIIYSIFSPFYEQVKNIIVYIGHARYILGMNAWVVTKRN